MVYSGIPYGHLQGLEPAKLAEDIKTFYRQRKDELCGTGQKLPQNMLNFITTGEFGLGGAFHKEDEMWKWLGENAHSETYIPVIAEALRDLCKEFEAEYPGQHFLLCVNNVFYPLQDGEKIAVNHDGEKRFLASNITIAATSTETALFDRYEASSSTCPDIARKSSL